MNSLESAILAGSTALSQAATDAGWVDFCTHRSGRASGWITAYVLATGVIRDKKYRHLYQQLSSTILEHGGIGYNQRVPPDSDSTSLAIYALLAAPEFLSDLLISVVDDFLSEHCRSSGGLATYKIDGGLLEYKQFSKCQVAGWCQTPVDEISAVAASAALRLPHLKVLNLNTRDWLLSLPAQGTRQYWWVESWYLYGWLADLLILICPQPVFRRTTLFLADLLRSECERILPEDLASPLSLGSYLIVNNSLTSLGYNLDQNQINRAIDQLIKSQNSEGLWTSDNILRIPYPWDSSPWNSNYFSPTLRGTGGLHGDMGIFSTATILKGLQPWK